MLGIVRDRNAPGKCAAADRKIAQAGAHERHHFVAPRFGTNEIRLAGVELQQLVLKCRELEEIILFFHRLRGTPAFGAGRAWSHDIHVELVEDAVLAGVAALVDVAFVAEHAPQRLHALLVFVGRGANEVVVGQAHPVPESAEFGGDFVGELLRSFSRSLRRALDLLSVFVGAGEEVSVKAHQALAPCNGVAGNRGVGVPDVRTRIHVINRGRDVKLFAHLDFRIV